MKRIFEHIDRASVELAGHPVFLHLGDSSVDARERLRFVPHTAHFIMSFADLCRFFLPVHPAPDRYQELANLNLAEEGDHWKWFLADLTSLGLDPELKLTDAIRSLWSDETIRTRKLTYELCATSASLSSLERLVLVLAIEATGKVALEAAAPAGREAARLAGKTLVYFGSHHLDSELGHTLSEHDVRRELAEAVLEPPELAKLEELVDRVFGFFREMLDEAFHATRSLKAC